MGSAHNPPPLYPPRAVQNVTAAGGITATTTELHVQGDGGPITITANPQIAAGVQSQLLILHGQSDTNTLTLSNGTGIHIHSATATLRDHDVLVLIYEDDSAQWIEQSRNFSRSEKTWFFASRAGASGTTYAGGFYEFGGASADFDPGGINFGTANASKAAHVLFVVAEQTANELTLRVTGTSITDGGVRVTSDTQDVVIPASTVVDTYFETSKKWLGTVAITVVSGDPKLCNYGFAKYWDNSNSDFLVTGLECTFLAASNDTAPDILLRHHKATGWTSAVGGPPVPPTAIASMATDHGTEDELVGGENGAWKRTNLLTSINGGNGEGTIIEIVTSANNAFRAGNCLLTIRPN